MASEGEKFAYELLSEGQGWDDEEAALRTKPWLYWDPNDPTCMVYRQLCAKHGIVPVPAKELRALFGLPEEDGWQVLEQIQSEHVYWAREHEDLQRKPWVYWEREDPGRGMYKWMCKKHNLKPKSDEEVVHLWA